MCCSPIFSAVTVAVAVAVAVAVTVTVAVAVVVVAAANAFGGGGGGGGGGRSPEARLADVLGVAADNRAAFASLRSWRRIEDFDCVWSIVSLVGRTRGIKSNARPEQTHGQSMEAECS